ncbi:dihydrodipicolinate synthase family protein [Cognatishimia sp. WU-CL00825]|uniref:dihydrodipicolinate synthase family protein n=1 Tax=Cognatishimia sp. WU-CL00825 TaxID=3127658 RepID=UPI00310C75E5
MKTLTGVLPIVPTPFAVDGTPDHSSLAKVVDDAIAFGAAALVYPGVASEDVHLTSEERMACLDVVVSRTNGRVPVIAGVNTADPAEMVALAGKVAAQNVQAIMAMAVPDMRPDYAGWFHKIEEASGGLPIILQNLFAPRGADLSAEEMIALAKAVPSIRYVKEEGVPSGIKVSELVAACGPDLDAVIGGGGARYLLEELDRGAVATMPAIELLELHVDLMQAYLSGDRDTAKALYVRSLPILLTQAPFRMRLTKLILKHRGLVETDIVRERLPDMDDALKMLIIEFYEEAMSYKTSEASSD